MFAIRGAAGKKDKIASVVESQMLFRLKTEFSVRDDWYLRKGSHDA
jgi:hypothetical protein